MKELAQQARALIGLQLNRAQLAALETYERELLSWNARFNLTAIDDPQKVRIKHFLDSLTCLLAMRNSTMDRVIDIGTGAGFPGIPLKIVCPNMRLTLVESVGKKAAFCQHMVEILHLRDVEVLPERAEAVGSSTAHREAYDWALARAVATMPIVMEYLLPLVRVGGHSLAMKGESGPAEAQAAEGAMRLLGGHLHQLLPVTLPGVEDQRYLIIVEKVAATPDRYPRRSGLPTKKPL